VRPKVSIGLPVYNGDNYLREALGSLLGQTFSDFELVISDNGSVDDTRTICEEFAAADERVRYHRSDVNRGGTWNFNRVLELSTGEYFRWAAHDDLIAPTYLQRCVEALDADPDAVLCHTRVEIIDEHGANHGLYVGPPMRRDDPRVHVRFRDAATYGGRCHQIFGLMRRDALLRIPPYGDYGHADGVLLARLILLGPFIELAEPLQLMREHGEQVSTSSGVKGATEQGQTGGIDYLAWREWFDPKFADSFGFPYWRIVGEYARSLIVVPGVPLSQRVRCLEGVWAAAWTTKGRMKHDVVRAVDRISTKLRPTER
jgi:glycosyltransferase involved in cell wall biosynthesis